MPLQQTSGNDTSDAYGGGAAVVPSYIEDVFSTYLYTGNGSTQTITNGIDLTSGGLLWTKQRSTARDNALLNTSSMYYAASNSTAAAVDGSPVWSISSTGFSLLAAYPLTNSNNGTYATWAFKKKAKFFDVVTYTGDGNSGRTVAHNLGSVPGCIIFKRTDSTSNWFALCKNGTNYEILFLNTTDPTYGQVSISSCATSTVLNIGYITSQVGPLNTSGATYVAYLYANNAGGFGLTGTDNVISCGSYATNSSAVGSVTLGWEPQWVLLKASSGASDWLLVDNMRGFIAPISGAGSKSLSPNTSAAESTVSGITVNATGFVDDGQIVASGTVIYIAIRRGPMKTPTDATSVYQANTYTGNATANTTVAGNFGFPVDLMLLSSRDASATSWSSYGQVATDRLRGSYPSSATASTTSEIGGWNTYQAFDVQNSIGWGLYGSSSGSGYFNNSGGTFVARGFQRAPGFFDEVCYTGTGAYQTVTHNLGVAPELWIVKCRSSAIAVGWPVGSTQFSASYYAVLNTTAAAINGPTFWGGTYPTSTSLTIGPNTAVGGSGSNYVAYLFATCAGVSKVGSYTGNGTTQTINCGFTAGARFVLIKRTDSAGDWYVYDTARGMTTLTDPYLLLNTTAAESATLGSVTTVTTGFAVNATILAAINTSAATYIFLAIA